MDHGRHLERHELDWLRDVDALGQELQQLLDQFHEEPGIDEFWLSQGRTQLQQGLMSVRRAIAKPRTF